MIRICSSSWNRATN